jgi:hypothetical protein
MKKQPDEITLAKLQVIVMPNGEVMCLGGRVGYFDKLGKYLSEPTNGITGEPIIEEE